jgi:4-hydroxy-3-methylbut-2-enyl diphosphate reductase
MNIEYIDATCPFVKAIHERVKKAADEGLPVVIVGEAGHPEVVGILGWSGTNSFVVNSEEDLIKLPKFDKAVVVAQTTITEEKWEAIVRRLSEKIDELLLFCSICSATRERQKEAKELALKCDTIIVVGDESSSNTRKLYELCLNFCKSVYYIQEKNEVLLEIIRNGGIIGIVAGASTPDTMIREVYDYMIENEKVLPIEGEEEAASTDAAIDTVDTDSKEEVAAEVQEEPAAEETQEPVAEETVAAEANEETAAEETQEPTKEEPEEIEESVSEESEETEDTTEKKAVTEQDVFLEGLENVIRLKKGQLVKGKIVQITDTDICVNIGYKSDGVMLKSELAADDEEIIDNFSEGDEIEAEVISLNDGEGNVLLSRKRIERRQKWQKMKENVGSDKVYTCVIQKAVKGGVTTKVEGYSTFIPASHMSLKYIEDLKQFEGKEVEVVLIDADKRQERLVASHKNVLLKQTRENESQVWDNFKKGDTIKGTVKRLTDFGAFVDVGGVDGLLHISDLAWSRVKHPSDVVSEGQELELLILNVDKAKKKIALGYKQLLPKPWDLVPQKYHVGDVINGKIVRIVPFGAFVQLEPTVDGLIHISQITNHRLERVEDELRLGDEIEVKILDVNADKRKISLSRKALLEPEEKPEEKKEKFVKEDNFSYELPPVEESTQTLGDFFPKIEE